jgi:hypothetical protein
MHGTMSLKFTVYVRDRQYQGNHLPNGGIIFKKIYKRVTEN